MIEEAVESGLPPAKAMLRPPGSPLKSLTAVHCLVAFAFATTDLLSEGEWVTTFAVSLIFAQVQMASIIAALGSGPYWKRLAISQFSIAAVFFSYYGGAFVAANSGRMTAAELFLTTGMATHILVASAASQFVFGFFRVTREWRIHPKGTERGVAFSLHDLFIVTLFAAVTLAAINANLPKFGDSAGGFLVTAVTFGAATLFYGVPTIMTTFRMKETEQGCFAQLIIVVSIGFLMIMPFAAMGAGPIIGPLAFLLAVCSLTTWLPLATMRENGYVLTNGTE